MAYFEFPHTRTYDTDLGWLIKAFKDISAKLDEYLENAVITFADPITWDITEQYTALTCVIDSDGTAYLSKQPVPAGVDISNTDYWLPIFNYDDNMNYLRSQIAYNARNLPTTGEALTAGDLVFWNSTLYRVLVDMPAGTAFIIGTNIDECTVDEKINDVTQDIDVKFSALRSMIAYNAGASPTSTIALKKGDLVFWKSSIYEAMYDMPAGTAFIVDTNITAYTVDRKINDLADKVEELEIYKSYVTPEEYGAVGDGVTDDYAAFAAMFADQPGFVVLRATEYYISGDIQVDRRCHIMGNGAKLIIPSTSAQRAHVFTLNAPTVVEDLEAYSVNDKQFLNYTDVTTGVLSSNKILFYIMSDDCSFRHIYGENLHTIVFVDDAHGLSLHNLFVDDITGVGAMFGIFINRIDNVYVSNVDITIEQTANNVCHALYICQYATNVHISNYKGYYAGASDPTILGLHASSVSGIGLINTDIYFENCYFEQAGTAAASIIDTSACRDVYFNHCRFIAAVGTTGLTVVINNGAVNVQFNDCYITCGGYASTTNGMILGRFQQYTDFILRHCRIEFIADSATQNVLHRFGNIKVIDCDITDIVGTNVLTLCDSPSAAPYAWTMVFMGCNVHAFNLQPYAMYDGALDNMVAVEYYNNIFYSRTARTATVSLPVAVQTTKTFSAVHNGYRGYGSIPSSRADYVSAGQVQF